MFGVGVFEYQSQRRGGLAALVLLAPMLAGCSSFSMPSFSMPSFSSWFGSSGADANAAGAPLPMDFECPEVQVRQGAATLTSSSNPADPNALNLRYQVSISTTARECRLLPGNILSIKVGLQGRVILGPEGAPGPVDVPVRFAVVREGIDPRPITTKLDRVAVMVPPSDGNVLFTHVSEALEFPMPRVKAEIDSYVVYIGFDSGAVQEPEKEKKKPKPKVKPAARRTT